MPGLHFTQTFRLETLRQRPKTTYISAPTAQEQPKSLRSEVSVCTSTSEGKGRVAMCPAGVVVPLAVTSCGSGGVEVTDVAAEAGDGSS